jgi:phage FluMu gp28-like protein
MAKDTLFKLRNLLEMKGAILHSINKDLIFAQDLVEALRGDLEHAVMLIQRKDAEIEQLQDQIYNLQAKEWEQQDKDENWLADYLANHPVNDVTVDDIYCEASIVTDYAEEDETADEIFDDGYTF